MSSIEQRREERDRMLAEGIEVAPSAVERLEGIRNQGHRFEEQAAARIQVTGELLDSIEPDDDEDAATLLSLKARAEAVSPARMEDMLRKLTQAAALAIALQLAAMQGEGTKSPDKSMSVEMLAENPDIMETLMRSIVAAASGPAGFSGNVGTSVIEAEARDTLVEIQKTKGSHETKLVLRIAERVFRLLLDKTTLGFGPIIYDSLKDTALTLHEKRKESSSIHEERPKPLVLESI